MPAYNILTLAVASISNGGTTAGSRVHVGSRLQSGTLPAVVVEQISSERATLGTGSSASLVRHAWRLSAIAQTMTEARALAESAASYATPNMTSLGYVTYRTTETVVEEPQSGEGDEEQPAAASLTLETLFPE